MRARQNERRYLEAGSNGRGSALANVVKGLGEKKSLGPGEMMAAHET